MHAHLAREEVLTGSRPVARCTTQRPMKSPGLRGISRAKGPRTTVPGTGPDTEAVASVGSKGDSHDKAMAEAFDSLIKAELVRNRGPRKGIDDLEIAVAEYIDWFTYRRLHGETGLVPPVEYETTHHSITLPEQPAQRQFTPSIKPGT